MAAVINSKYALVRALIWCRVSLFIKTTPVNPRSINAFNKMKECKAYDSIESAKGDCRSKNDASDKYSTSVTTLFDVPEWSFRELKTLYLSDQNNQKVQNNGSQYEINEKYNRYWPLSLRDTDRHLPLWISRSELCCNRSSSQPWEGILISLESHCIDIPRTPVDCCHLSVKTCTRWRKGKKASRERYDYRWSRTYLPYIRIKCSTEAPN